MNRIEVGEVDPRVAHLLAIAEILGVTPDTLLLGTGLPVQQEEYAPPDKRRLPWRLRPERQGAPVA